VAGTAPGGTIGEWEGGGGGGGEGGGGVDAMMLTVDASNDCDEPLDRSERSTEFFECITLKCLARSRRRLTGRR